MERRQLGCTSIKVSPVALGCWPIAGMTSLDVNEADSVRTIEAAVEAGINFFDTAHCYGADGESERLLGRVLGKQRSRAVIATKGGIHWRGDERILDATAGRLRTELQTSLERLRTDYVDLYYLHVPDPSTDLDETAAELSQFVKRGYAKSIGASNVSLEQAKRIHQICPLTAIQPAYNMLLRDIEQELIPWCRQHQVSVMPYWPLMKGLLAGKLTRTHQFQPGDGRAKYSVFRGEEWQRNQDLLDDLRVIANDAGRTVAQLVINWTIHQPGITSALCGAKRAHQIEETAGAVGWTMTPSQIESIDAALLRRGRSAVVKAV